MIRIGFLPTSFEIDRKEAGNITLRLLCKELVNRNKVYIFTGNIRGKKKIEYWRGVRIVRKAPIRRIGSQYEPIKRLAGLITHIFTSWVSYYRDIPLKKLDIVHGISSSSWVILRTLLFKWSGIGKVYVHTVRGNSTFRQWPSVSRWLFNQLDCIIVLTSRRKRLLIEGGISENKIKVIRSPVDTNKFIPKNRQLMREKYSMAEKFIIIYYGHFNKFKGVEYLIKSMNGVNKKSKRLVLVPSSDDSKSVYDSLIKNTRENVTILPANSNIVEVIAIADVIVLPYPELVSTEETPSCILESMACGRAVITSRLPELEEVFTDKKNILFARPKDSKDIANKINLLMNNQQLRRKIVCEGAKMVKMFDAKLVSEEHMKVYESMLMLTENNI